MEGLFDFVGVLCWRQIWNPDRSDREIESNKTRIASWIGSKKTINNIKKRWAKRDKEHPNIQINKELKAIEYKLNKWKRYFIWRLSKNRTSI